MMGMINYTLASATCHNQKKKEAQELKDVWDNFATKSEKKEMLEKFSALGGEGIKPVDRLKGVLEFQHRLKGGKREEVKVEENFHTRRVLPLSTHI